MKLKLYIFLTVFLLGSNLEIIQAQVDDLRKSESDIKIEDRFVAAKYLVVAGKSDDAIKLLDTIRRESGPNAAVYFELAKLYNIKKDYVQTETNLNQAVKLDGDNIWLRIYEVNFYKDLGRFDDAIKTLKHLVNLNPKNPDFYDQIVSLLIKTNKLDDALLILNDKETNLGFSVNTILKKAEILDNAGRVLDAAKEIEKLIAMNPSDTKYYKLAASMLRSNDRFAEALNYYRKILAIDPNDQDAKLAVVLTSDKSITPDDYLTTLVPIIKNENVSIDIKIKELLPFVEKHAQSQDSVLGRQLINICDQLVIAHPNEAKSHAIYGDVLMNNNEVTAAIRQYEKTLTINDRNFIVWEQLMFGLEATENYDQLLKVSADAIDYFPNQAISYYLCGKSLAIKMDYKKAKSFLEEASLISAGNINILSRVASMEAFILLKQKTYVKALEKVDESLNLSAGKNYEALEIKGDIYKEQNNIIEANKWWTQSKLIGNKSLGLEQKLQNLKGN